MKLDQDQKQIKRKNNTYESTDALRELTLNTFKNGIFPLKSTQGKERPSDLACVAKVLKY